MICSGDSDLLASSLDNSRFMRHFVCLPVRMMESDSIVGIARMYLRKHFKPSSRDNRTFLSNFGRKCVELHVALNKQAQETKLSSKTCYHVRDLIRFVQGV
jgi:hypothetical protein